MATAIASRQAPTVEGRVESLRRLSQTDAVGAQDAAWGWFERLGRLAAVDREDAAAQLGDLFETGRPPDHIDGPTDGILVAPLIHPFADSVARRVTKVWMPWMGKR